MINTHFSTYDFSTWQPDGEEKELQYSKKRRIENGAERPVSKRRKTEINSKASIQQSKQTQIESNQALIQVLKKAKGRPVSVQSARVSVDELTFGEGCYLCVDVFVAYVLPRLPIKALHSLILANRAYSTLFKIKEVLNKLCLNPKINCFKLASAVGASMQLLTHAYLKSAVDNKQICSFLKQCPGLISIDLTGCEKITTANINTLTQKCLQLKSLSVKMYNSRDVTAVKLIKAFSALESLYLEQFPIKSLAVIHELNQKCTQLTNLHLSCSEIEDAHLAEVFKSCVKLESVALKSCKALRAPLSMILRKCSNLTKLDLSNCKSIIDVNVPISAVVCKRLTSVNLGGCDRITDLAVRSLFSCNTNLVSLNLNDCSNITTNTALIIVHNWTNLTNLSLSNCYRIEKEALYSLFKFCSRLESLDLNNLANLTDEVVKEIFSCRPSLRHLRLNYNERITNLALINVAETCRHLERFESNLLQKKYIGMVDEINQLTIKALAMGCPNLTHLDFINRPISITERDFQIFVQHCTKLEELKLSQGAKISDEGISELVRKCTNLTSLHLLHFPLVNGSFIKDLKHCPNLKKLHLESCQKLITIIALDLLIKYCPSLEDFYIDKCAQDIPVHMLAFKASLVSDYFFRFYHPNFPHLKVSL